MDVILWCNEWIDRMDCVSLSGVKITPQEGDAVFKDHICRIQIMKKRQPKLDMASWLQACFQRSDKHPHLLLPTLACAIWPSSIGHFPFLL